MAIKFDPIDLEPKKVNTAFIKSQFKKLGRDYVSIFVLMTILQPRKFAFFDVEVSAGSLDHTLSDLISWKHLLNNYLVACKFKSTSIRMIIHNVERGRKIYFLFFSCL
jgi:signal peptidase I